MKNENDRTELSHIDSTVFYDTRGAAALLGESEGNLRLWRHKNIGPKYIQSADGARCKYLGLWLIDFRNQSIVEPSATVGGDKQ